MKKPLHTSNDTFLARWLAGELTQEETMGFEASGDFLTFKKINETTQQLQPPRFNENKVKQLINKRVSSDKNNTKVRRLKPLYWFVSVAACFALFIVSYFMFFNLTTHQTFNGQTLVVTLPDGSEVNLNADSKIEYKKWSWNKSRRIELIGEAFFKVKKGDKFRVNTKQGTVTVLGTEFNVKNRKDYFEVNCYEGKVKVETIQKEAILTANKNLRINANKEVEEWNSETINPAWLNNESTFRNVQLSLVINELKRQYDIDFEENGINQNQIYTGAFPNDNLNLALKLVFNPTNISYTFTDERTITLSQP